MAVCAPSVPASEQSFAVEKLESEGAWALLRPEWDALLAQSLRPSPFLCWDWLDAWRRSFAATSRLQIFTLRDEAGRLAALAPLHLVRRRVAGVPLRSLELLGYRGARVCADHMDFPAVREQRARLCAELMAAIRADRGWDVLVLADLCEDSPLPELLPCGGRTAAESCSCLTLPGTPAALWAGLRRRHPQFAQNLRRYQRRLARHHAVRFVAPVPAQEVAESYEALVRLHALARARHGEAGNFACAAYRNFHRSIVERWSSDPRLYVARLDCDGQTVAVFYGYVLGGVLYFYQSGFDTRLQAEGIGKLLLAAVMEDAITRLHLREFDFLRGDEAYKRLWTDGVRRTTTVRLWRSGLGAACDRVRHRLAEMRRRPARGGGR